MSDRAWRFYLDDMLMFAEKVILYTDGLNPSVFEKSGLHDDASFAGILGSIVQSFGDQFLYSSIEEQATMR